MTNDRLPDCRCQLELIQDLKAPVLLPEKEEFILEDCYQRNGTYVIKRLNTEEEVFRVTFDEEGKLLTLKQRSVSFDKFILGIMVAYFRFET